MRFWQSFLCGRNFDSNFWITSIVTSESMSRVMTIFFLARVASNYAPDVDFSDISNPPLKGIPFRHLAERSWYRVGRSLPHSGIWNRISVAAMTGLEHTNVLSRNRSAPEEDMDCLRPRAFRELWPPCLESKIRWMSAFQGQLEVPLVPLFQKTCCLNWTPAN